MSEPQAEYDSPWKEALEYYFAEFMAFFFPQAHDDIDWEQEYEFLDKELQQIAPEAEVGPRLVDKLVKVWRAEGEEAWVLVHVVPVHRLGIEVAGGGGRDGVAGGARV